MWDVNGVVDVVDRLGEGEAVPPAQTVPRDADLAPGHPATGKPPPAHAG